MDIITIDGMVEHDFRLSVEDMLRLDQVDEAVERLQVLVMPYCGEGGILPPCFRTAARRRVEIGGWNRLGERLSDHDRKDRPISAIGVTLADATKLGGPGPSRGRMTPFIKTFYFSDEAYPFSTASREDLLDGYSRDGFEWQGDYQATDATLSVRGLDDLYAPIFTLEQQLLARPDPDAEEIRAGTVGACLIAVLIHRALRDAIRNEGLPRPLCVIAACDGVYPFFDAPVAGIEDAGAEADASEAGEAAVGSLLNLISRRPAKAMVMTLDAEDAEEALRFDEMAAAQSLDGTAGRALSGSLDLAGLREAQAANGAWDDWDEGWDSPEEHADRPPPAGWAPPMPGSADFQPLPFFDPASVVTYDDDAYPDAPFVSGADVPPQLPQAAAPVEADLGEDPEAQTALLATDPPLQQPASHSIRAKIAVAQVDGRAPGEGPARRLMAWLRSKFPGH